MAQRLDWDDLRYVLAVADEGSLAGGARSLGVNHTTVLRRIGAIEKRLGLRLFERLPSGYLLTAGGKEMIVAARNVDDTIAALERRLAGRDLKLSGPLRITTTDTLMASVLPAALGEFADQHSGVTIEIAIANAMYSLTRRDADVAVRPATNPPSHLVGRRIASLAFAIYASPRYLDRTGISPSLSAPHRWLAPDDSLSASTVARWMHGINGQAEIVARADSLLALRDLAREGVGVTALPCYLGDLSPGLTRLGEPIAAMTSALWVLTHEDLRETARVRAFTEFVSEAFIKRRALLEGRAGGEGVTPIADRS